MRKLFKSQWKQTQPFGPDHFLTINKKEIKASEYYGQFGLKGHEGGDYVPTGSVWDVLNLEDGVVVRDIDDAAIGKNYGKNVTVWCPSIGEAFQYCHLESNSVKLGDRVVKGQVLGVMGKTGNTTGAHVHLNRFKVDANGIRLNKDNGFLGGIDPLPFLESDVTSQPTTPQEIVERADAFVAVATELGSATVKDVVLAKIQGMKEEQSRLEDANQKQSRELTEKSARVTELDAELNKIKEDYAELEVKVKRISEDNDKLQKAKVLLEGKIADLSLELSVYKQSTKTGIIAGIKLIIQGLKDLFGRR